MNKLLDTGFFEEKISIELTYGEWVALSLRLKDDKTTANCHKIRRKIEVCKRKWIRKYIVKGGNE